MELESVRRAFYRHNLVERKHYFKASPHQLRYDNLSHLGRAKEITFLTFLGVWKLLPTFRGDIPNLLFLVTRNAKIHLLFLGDSSDIDRHFQPFNI